MPSFCAAYGCTNNSNKEDCKERNISFHKFPMKDIELLSVWLTKLRRVDFIPSEYSKLCSEHFEEECFYYRRYTGDRIIKPDAIPTKFVYQAEGMKRKRISQEFNEMVYCFVPDCKHSSEKHDCGFYNFPLDQIERMIWIKNIRRGDKMPTRYSRVCRCHFKDGCKTNGPTIFERNESPKRKMSLQDEPIASTSSESTNSAEKMNDSLPVEEIEDTSEKINYSLPKKISAARYEVLCLKKEIEDLKKENEKLRWQSFGFHVIENDENLINYYTGLQSKQIFNLILDECTVSCITYVGDCNIDIPDQADQLLLCLMKLKLNLGYIDLSVRFNVNLSTVINTFITWLDVLHDTLFVRLMKIVPSRSKNQQMSLFTSSRDCKIIIDSAEFSIMRPSKIGQQKLFFSNHKHRHTMKGIIGIAPNGVIAFCSELHPGSTSDADIIVQAGLINILQPGDVVFSDKGSLLRDVLPDTIEVNIPPVFAFPDFISSHESDTFNCASSRIFIDKAIKRIKVFKITKLLPRSCFPYNSKIVQVCVALTNFKPPI